MNIVIPMGGLGNRVKGKFGVPKPLVALQGKTIIEHCLESFGIEGQYIFIVRKFAEFEGLAEQHYQRLIDILKKLKPDCRIVTIPTLTDGPVSSVLAAKEHIDNDNELIVTNCDQKTFWNPWDFIKFTKDNQYDGCVTTYSYPNIILDQPSPYSFVQVDENRIAIKFEEKLAISLLAMNGIHYWKHGSDFVSSAELVIKNNDRVNNEFYVSRTYNYLIKQNKKIGVFKMVSGSFAALGSVNEIEEFLRNENSQS
jgi:UDP-N-acetylglucosamine diphosphorylase / glucose-1-phosphate thymidylyltransferase / UDP-N-acetylgalactosamine diphosphorylase / glucosamine-1-phosphate N-acetyltransferase / galactosamine-1-phosphate N-acetyltransferase